MSIEESLKLDVTRCNQPQDKIFELVVWIDENEKQIVKSRDIFFNWKGAVLLLVVVSFAIVEVLNFVTSTSLDKVFTLLTLIVVFLAFMSIVVQTTERNVIETRLKNASNIKKFTDREKPMLKALIMIKSKNKELKLSMLYAADKQASGDVFTEKKLLEILCI